MKPLALAVIFSISAFPAFADSHVFYTEPVLVGEKETTSDHGSLPGGDKTKWSTQSGTPEYSDWVDTGEPEVNGNTSTQTQERSATQTDTALNPAQRTVGTDRFDPTSTWIENRQVITTFTPPPEEKEKEKKCEGNCGEGKGNGGGNGTDPEGNPKKK